MESCPSEDILAVFLDGDLPAVRRSEVEGHLDGCRSCLHTVARIAGEQSRKAVMETQDTMAGRSGITSELQDAASTDRICSEPARWARFTWPTIDGSSARSR
jgi:anti-sigma factor RsiW